MLEQGNDERSPPPEDEEAAETTCDELTVPQAMTATASVSGTSRCCVATFGTGCSFEVQQAMTAAVSISGRSRPYLPQVLMPPWLFVISRYPIGPHES
ncbi:hypothetical protein GRJ2_003194400 [Grus japonensis]|uniref:Uncharacterized protein n=1 Tax=Grus japonensis TaxID=30415 RepID=A0ABC9YB36_GRUJA